MNQGVMTEQYWDSLMNQAPLIVLERGQTFSAEEDLFKSVQEKVFGDQGYDKILHPHQLIQTYLKYRDIVDVPTLIEQMDQAQQEFDVIVTEQAQAREERQRQNGGMLTYPEPDSYGEFMEGLEAKRNIVAHCRVDVLKYLVKLHANRKGIPLTEDLHLLT